MVKREELSGVIAKLSQETVLSVDCETTGLRVWDKDKLFSIIIATATEEYYFNFQNYLKLDPACLLTKEDMSSLQSIFNSNQVIYLANAKFDMAVLYKEGITFKGEVRDVLVMSRLLNNEHLSYSLEDCAERIGLKKDDAVEEIISELSLFCWKNIPGKKSRFKEKFFYKVPPDIIVPYGKKDARITFDLGVYNQKELEKLASIKLDNFSNLMAVPQNEYLLTKTCFAMEKVGIKIDKDYCEKAIKYETDKCRKAEASFRELSGVELVDSNKALKEAFEKMGISAGTTDKGNASFTEDVLKNIKSPLAKCVQDYREAYKKATTYYQGFVYFADEKGEIHANIKQAGTTTGRFSYSDPNLQNIPKEEEEQEFKVRRVFIPRPEFCFVEFDYKAFEYRLLAEYAEEMELIKKINEGEDVHEATGKMMGVPRKTAKTLNFMLLYGGGAQKLADALGITLAEAWDLKAKYFSALPNIKKFITNVTYSAETVGFVLNWLGRRCHFKNKNFAYKAPNALIQGGCADIVKVAMNGLDKELSDKKSRMLLQVHDSILFEVHKEELGVLPAIKNILESAYPSTHLKMEVSCSHSWRSWGDMVDGSPV